MCAQSLLTSVSPNPRGFATLKQCYKKISRLLQKIPKDAAYRINTETIIQHRLSILDEANNDIKEIEDNIGCGKIELLISQAENEYLLIQKMILWKPWEPLMQEPPPGQWDWPPANV